MKKLSKISLKDAATLSDNQMKQVFGGAGLSPTSFGCESWIPGSGCYDNKPPVFWDGSKAHSGSCNYIVTSNNIFCACVVY